MPKDGNSSGVVLRESRNGKASLLPSSPFFSPSLPLEKTNTPSFPARTHLFAAWVVQEFHVAGVQGLPSVYRHQDNFISYDDLGIRNIPWCSVRLERPTVLTSNLPPGPAIPHTVTCNSREACSNTWSCSQILWCLPNPTLEDSSDPFRISLHVSWSSSKVRIRLFSSQKTLQQKQWRQLPGHSSPQVSESYQGSREHMPPCSLPTERQVWLTIHPESQNYKAPDIWTQAIQGRAWPCKNLCFVWPGASGSLLLETSKTRTVGAHVSFKTKNYQGSRGKY